jgi:hypothetical protein
MQKQIRELRTHKYARSSILQPAAIRVGGVCTSQPLLCQHEALSGLMCPEMTFSDQRSWQRGRGSIPRRATQRHVGCQCRC